MEIKIIKADNGFIVEHKEKLDDGSHSVSVNVFEEDVMDQFGEIKALCGALNHVQEYFGLGGSKHDKERLWIEVKNQKEIKYDVDQEIEDEDE